MKIRKAAAATAAPKELVQKLYHSQCQWSSSLDCLLGELLLGSQNPSYQEVEQRDLLV